MSFKIALLIVVVALNGCASTTVVTTKFPPTTVLLTTECPSLELVPTGTTKLSDLEKIVVGNYTKYHQCANQINGWNKWYKEEKQIYESVAK